MTMAQFEQTVKTIRATCSAKYSLSDEIIDGWFIAICFLTSKKRKILY